MMGRAQGVSVAGLSVVTTPPGAEVLLDGEADLSGISPVTFTYPAIGEYQLTIRKYGYETYKTRILIDPSKPQEIAVELKPKTTVKAVLRSAIFPGWGQRYTSQKGKGTFFNVLFVGSAVALFSTNSKFNDRRDDYDRSVTAYDNAVASGATYAELSNRFSAMNQAQAKAYDAETNRRIAAGIVVGVWGLNVLDALLFSPGERATFSIKGLSIAPTGDDGGFKVSLSRAF